MATQTDPSGTIVQETYDVSGATKAETYFQVTVTNAAQTLSALGATIPSWAEFVFVTPETGAIRYRCDGTAPTAGVGQPIAQGQAWPVQGLPSLQAASLISQSGSNVTVSLEFRG
jgi:hypothetical protein